MITSNKWTSIIEAIIVMVIVTVWVVWMYNIFTNSQKLSDSSAYRLSAIAMAREWIEAVTNIRDTNWTILSANNDNCWNTFNYDSSCIITDVNIVSWSYKIYNDINNRWVLSWATTWAYSDSTYRNNFRVNLDNNWFYTQSWWTNFLPIYTREIKISYPANAWNPPQSMNVQSIVRWSDSSRTSWNYEVKLETLLTNWKKD